MNDIYCLKIEVNIPGQMQLLDMILGVEHDMEEAHTWVLTMDYDKGFGDLPIFYITNFLDILENKYVRFGADRHPAGYDQHLALYEPAGRGVHGILARRDEPDGIGRHQVPYPLSCGCRGGNGTPDLAVRGVPVLRFRF